VYVRIMLGFFCVLAVIFAFTYDLAASVVREKRSFEDQVRAWTAERTGITEIDEILEYRGKEAYAVVIGKNRVGTPVIAWMNEKTLQFDTLERAVPHAHVEEAVRKGHPDAQIVKIVPGLDGDLRFWEVTLRETDGRFVYIHYDFYTGQVLKSYSVQAISS